MHSVSRRERRNQVLSEAEVAAAAAASEAAISLAPALLLASQTNPRVSTLPREEATVVLGATVVSVMTLGLLREAQTAIIPSEVVVLALQALLLSILEGRATLRLLANSKAPAMRLEVNNSNSHQILSDCPALSSLLLVATMPLEASSN